MEYVKPAIYETSFHGEVWYSCPYCNKSFEIHDTKFERGFKKTSNPKIFIHSNCGNKIMVN